MTQIFHYQSPIGALRLVADGDALVECCLIEGPCPPPAQTEPRGVLALAVQELNEYFGGRRTRFSVPLKVRGTDFQVLVWQKLATVPYGTAVTYAQLAAMAGCPRGARAVGGAVGANKLLIFIPCHRVVAAGGMGGFSAGLPAKQFLLSLEEES